MSKGRVWNKGKHNGAGLSKKTPAVNEAAGTAEATEVHNEVPNPRIDTVKPMNRENWVSRPARVVHKEPRNKE